MKIVFILQAFPALSETFILNQITGLLDKGHDVQIFALERGRTDIVHPDIEKYQLLGKTIILPHEEKNKWLRWTKQILLLPRNCIQNPHLLKCFKTLDSMRALLWPDACSLANYFKKLENIDIIHVQFANNAINTTYLKMAGVLSCPLVVSFRGSDTYVSLLSHPKQFIRVFKHADQLLPVSKAIKQILIEKEASKNKILVHHSGICIEDFPIFIREYSEKDCLRILCIARLVEFKGIGYLLEAVGCLHRQGYNIHLDILGDGPLRMVYLEQVRKSGISEIVQLHGSCNKLTVIKFLQQSHLLVCPSVRASNNAQEGIPNVIKEAMASGLPVIATRTGGIPELIEDGVSGFLVPQRDIDAIVDRITYLIKHPEIWPSMGRAGRSHIEANYDISKLNDRLVEIYQQLLNDKIELKHLT